MTYELNKGGFFDAVSVLIHEEQMRRALEQYANNPKTRNKSNYIGENGIVSEARHGAKLYFRKSYRYGVREIERAYSYTPHY